MVETFRWVGSIFFDPVKPKVVVEVISFCAAKQCNKSNCKCKFKCKIQFSQSFGDSWWFDISTPKQACRHMVPMRIIVITCSSCFKESSNKLQFMSHFGSFGRMKILHSLNVWTHQSQMGQEICWSGGKQANRSTILSKPLFMEAWKLCVHTRLRQGILDKKMFG